MTGRFNNPPFVKNPLPTATTPVAATAAGTAYTLTATSAAAVFGTTSPSITITAPGTYLLLARAQARHNGATFAASRTVTHKMRRTNNTAADVASLTCVTGIVTTLTAALMEHSWWAVYTTTNSNDVVTIFSDVSVLPTAGTLDLAEASIIAVRIA